MNLEEKIINIISETLGVDKDKVQNQADFFKDLNADKLEVIDLIIKIQQILNIRIEEGDFNKVQTVGDLINLIKENSDEF